jgi:hypothetical protein
MVFTDSTHKYFLSIPFNIRAAMARDKSTVPFAYEHEPFFAAYEVLYRIWVKRQPQKAVTELFHISKDSLKNWEDRFACYGALGLLPQLSYTQVDTKLEKLVVLIKSCRPHESASYALRLAEALNIPGASLELIRQIQRCHGYGQRLNENDVQYYHGLQHVLQSFNFHMRKESSVHDSSNRAASFYHFDRDPFQQRIELFKKLSECQKNRQIRPILNQFGVHPNRYYDLKERYMRYGVWGLIDLVQMTKTGEKISPELELQIIEQRLIATLSANAVIKNLI